MIRLVSGLKQITSLLLYTITQQDVLSLAETIVCVASLSLAAEHGKQQNHSLLSGTSGPTAFSAVQRQLTVKDSDWLKPAVVH